MSNFADNPRDRKGRALIPNGLTGMRTAGRSASRTRITPKAGDHISMGLPGQEQTYKVLRTETSGNRQTTRIQDANGTTRTLDSVTGTKYARATRAEIASYKTTAAARGNRRGAAPTSSSGTGNS